MRERYIVGLDIGTTKVCAVVGRSRGISNGHGGAGRGAGEVIAYGMAPCAGLKKGVVVDMEATVDSIRAAVREAEAASGLGIRAAYVGIAGSHIKCLDSFGASGIKGREITRADIERVIDSASSVYVPLDRDVLHVIPSDFTIDGQDGIVRPLGMSGVRLEARVNIVTASHSIVENLLKCCEKAGVKAIDVVLEPIASARAVLQADEMEAGVALIDIGGGTTDLAVYKNGKLRHTAIIPIGGNHLTNDIAIGLRLSQREAERVKKLHGSCLEDLASQTGEIEVTGMGGEEKKVPGRYIAEIIRPRCEELFGLLRAEIKDSMLYCAVLTGGTSLLGGIDRLSEAVLGLPARAGVPCAASSGRDAAGLVWESLKNPSCSTSVGLMLYGLDGESECGIHTDLIEKVSGWFRGLRPQGIKQSIRVLTNKI